MKTIVVPTDLSPESDAALSVAVDLARTYPARILLLHSVVYPLPMPAYAEAATITVNRTVEEIQEIEQTAKTALERMASNSAYKGVTILPTLLTNGQGLVDNVADQPADLIVMSSEGASGLEEWLIGSNAESIVRYAHCPVLIIKKPVAHFRPENIVCAIDLDDRLKTTQHYPFQLGEQGLHQFLYVLTPTDNRVPEGIRDWVNELAKAKGITEFDCAIHQASTVAEGIVEYADEVNADLILVFTHGYKGLRHLLAGSVAEDVLNHSTKPVLVMRV
ncbi:universal stress protein [Spirosoma foliorum]|uniref:Universal stress protein n=1 Tax=Spirosoma foliorum TaxID=2710596 RepID=A0A7G5GQ85_9BACT|nr:universal stress protein [Spirosoma foliorum]QMW01027.1 universal stress protein [Spirosoma foliorum]